MVSIDKKESKERMDLARKVIELMHVKENHIKSIKEKKPHYQFDEGMREAIVAESIGNIDSLIEMTVFTYASKFNEKDLGRLIEFYKSPIGTKLINLSWYIDTDIQNAIAGWSKAVLDRAQERYQKNLLKMKAEEGINARDYIPPLKVNNW